MGIEQVLKEQGWHLEPRKDWTAVQDQRSAFRSTFGTGRVGKLVGSKFYVTVRELRGSVERMLRDLGLKEERIASTSGSGAVYPGFACETLDDITLKAFVAQLHAEINQRVST